MIIHRFKDESWTWYRLNIYSSTCVQFSFNSDIACGHIFISVHFCNPFHHMRLLCYIVLQPQATEFTLVIFFNLPRPLGHKRMPIHSRIFIFVKFTYTEHGGGLALRSPSPSCSPHTHHHDDCRCFSNHNL